MDVISPCNQTCTLMDDMCIGCGRTTAELAAWSQLSSDERKTIMAQLPTRTGHEQSAPTPEA